MSTPRPKPATRTAILDNPLDDEQLLLEVMYGKRGSTTVPTTQSSPLPQSRAPQPKPEHYKVVSISLYNEDIERLDSIVRELKRRGCYKANRSQVIRHALTQFDLESVPRGR